MKHILQRKLNEQKQEYRTCCKHGYKPEAKQARRAIQAIIRQIQIIDNKGV